MKLIKRISLVLLILLSLVVMVISWVITTQSGLYFAINTIVRWVPELEIMTISGSCNDLNLEGVSYQTNGVNIYVDKIHLSLQVHYLKRVQVLFNHVSIEGIDIKIDTKSFLFTKKKDSSKPLTKLSTLYPILLNQLILKNINILVDNIQISLSKFAMAANWQANILTIKPTTMNGLVVNLPKTLAAGNQETKKIVVKITNTLAEKLSKKTLKELFAEPLLTHLPEVIFPMNINIEQFLGVNWYLVGNTNITIDHLTLIANIHNKQISIKQFKIITPKGKIILTGTATLAQQWPINLAVQAEHYINNLKGQQIDFKLEGSLLQQIKVILSLTGYIKATLLAKVALSQIGLPIQLIIESQQINWPLQGKSKYRLKNLQLHLNGKVLDYRLSLQTNIDGQYVPPTLLTINAKGNGEQFNLTRLQLNALQGKTKLTGIIDWSKGISWNGLLTLSGIDTAKQWPQWPAKLQGKIAIIGSIHEDNWQLKIPEITLDGSVNGNLLRTRGQISGNTIGQWNIPFFNILLGRNNLDISGYVSDLWQLDGVIDAPDLNSIFSSFSGVIKGQLKLRGDFKLPQLMVDLAVHRIKWQDNLTINKATIKGIIYSNKQIHSQLAVTIHKLKQANLIIHNFKLYAKGNEQQHSIVMNITGKPISGNLTLKGHFKRQKTLWQGLLGNTYFNTPLGEWQLNQDVTIEYTNQQQEITFSPHCWLNDNGHLCLSKTAKIGKFSYVNIRLLRFDLVLLKSFLPAQTQLTGNLDGNIIVRWYRSNRFPQANINLLGNNVKIIQLIEGSLLPVECQTLILNAGINNGKIVLQWLMQITNNGKFSGNIKINDLEQSRKLSGRINIKNISLAFIRLILTKGEKLDGNLNVNLRLSGNMKKPLLNGNLELSDIVAKGHWFPLDINHGFLKLNFMGTNSKLIGRINTTAGYLNLTGEAIWRNIKTWQAKIAVTANKLRITTSPMIHIEVEPNIILKATSNLLNLNGNINIPWARIKIQKLPESAVGISSDEVMLDTNLHPIKKKNISIPILTNLQINIGNDVSLDAFGLKAQLTGILKVIHNKQGLGLNGQINIPNSRFYAYGQDLIVRKGHILFSGPIDQPFLHIEAIRNPESTNDNVIVGVRITGIVNKPQVIIFSEPVKSQEEALSYLLKGQGLSSSDTAASIHIATLLIRLGISQNRKLLGIIGETFGVSEFILDTQGVGNNSQVVVSGKITNNLQVKYSLGIFNSLATVTLRYCLMPKLYLEAVSGVNQALNLIYQFEF